MSADEAGGFAAQPTGPRPEAGAGAPGEPLPGGVSTAEPGAIEVTGRREPEAGGIPPVAAAAGSGASRFEVEVPGYRGSLAGLVAQAQRGEIDLTTVPVHRLTGDYRRAVAGAVPPVEPGEIADFLGLAARLLSLKAQRVIPDGPLDGVAEEISAAEEVADLPGRRLAEYRLFREAADALLSEAAEEGARSFLGLVVPEVLPVERLAIPPERLAAALRDVLLRIDARTEVLAGVPTFSVEEKVAGLRAALLERGRMTFEELFTGVGSRMEAVAVFLALLELLRQGGARVEQREPFGPITVSGLG